MHQVGKAYIYTNTCNLEANKYGSFYDARFFLPIHSILLWKHFLAGTVPGMVSVRHI